MTGKAKYKQWRAFLGVLALFGLLIVSACRDQEPVTPTQAPVATATSEPVAPLPTETEPAEPPATIAPEPTAAIEPSPAPTATAEEQAIAASRMSLAELLERPVEDITVVEIEAAEWADGCLGLGGPAESCLQVVTPGYRVTLAAGDVVRVLRTDETGSQVRLEEPTDEIPPTAGQVREWLAEALRIEPDELSILSAIPQEWSDGCLGLGGPDELCLQAITPGYEVTFELGTRQIAARMDESGATARLASASAPGPEDVIFSWKREGGIAGFCDEMTVWPGGAFAAGTCAGTPIEGTLPGDQLAQLESWVSAYRPFVYVEADPAIADAMTITLTLLGAGTQAPLGADQQAMVSFAGSTYAEVMTPTGDLPAPDEWIRVLVPSLEMSFPVRAGWVQQEEATIWEAQGGTVLFEAVSDPGQPVALLPPGSQITRQEAVDLGWATGVRIKVRLQEATGEATYYVLQDPDGLGFLFAATAPTSQALSPLEDDLSRMVSAVTFSEGQDKVSGPTQTVVDFLAAWLYDEPGAVEYLSARLQVMFAAGTLEDELGIPSNDYRTFNVQWISTGNGASQVRIVLTYAAGTQIRVLDLIQVDGAWVIDGASS